MSEFEKITESELLDAIRKLQVKYPFAADAIREATLLGYRRGATVALE